MTDNLPEDDPGGGAAQGIPWSVQAKQEHAERRRRADAEARAAAEKRAMDEGADVVSRRHLEAEGAFYKAPRPGPWSETLIPIGLGLMAVGASLAASLLGDRLYLPLIQAATPWVMFAGTAILLVGVVARARRR